MALELLVRNTNFYTYRSCAGNWIPFPPGATTGYHGWCGTGQQYFESIVLFDSFVYDAAIDRYRFVVWSNIANWPSWEISTVIVHPETGVVESRVLLVGYAVAHAWTDPMYNAALNKVVAGYIVVPLGPGSAGYGIVDVTLPDGIPTTEQVNNPYVTQTQIPILAGTNFGYALSIPKKYIAICTAMSPTGVQVYDYSPYPSAAVFKWSQPLPETFTWGVGYEDEQYMWILSSGSNWNTATDGRQSLLKYNYLRNRIELLTELQTAGSSDRMTGIAFDTKRKKLGVVRIRPDLTNGQHDNAFEIYAPQIAATKVTVPVNIVPISDESRVTFVSHVLGSKGEAGGSREVTISCSPTAALITTPKLITEANGRVDFTIEPHTAGASEAVTVSHVDTKVLT